MASSLSLVTAAVGEPVTLAEAKRHLRVDINDDDELIADGISQARERVELETGRQLITATWDLRMDRTPALTSGWPALTEDWASGGWPWGGWPWQGFIDVPRAPLQSVTSITYVDLSGTTQTWASSNYLVDAPAGPTAPRGRISPVFGAIWPFTRDQINALTVRFVAGYGSTADSVPRLLRRALLLMLGDIYEHREDTASPTHAAGTGLTPLPYGVAAILQQYRVRPIVRAA